MKLLSTLLAASFVVVAAPACKGKDDPAAKGGPAAPAEQPLPTCKPGELVQAGACVAVVTAATVQAVQQQGDRLDQLGKVLDDVAVVAGPIELLKAFRELDAWKQMVSLVPELAKAEGVIDTLDQGVKQLATFRASLGDVRTRLGAIAAEVQAVYDGTGTRKKVEDVRAMISAEVAAATTSLEAATQQLVEQVVAPALAQLQDVAAIVEGACALGKLKGGGADFDKLCAQARGVFGPAQTYLAGLRTEPAMLLRELTTALQTQLAALLDQAAAAALDGAQTRVDALLKTP